MNYDNGSNIMRSNEAIKGRRVVDDIDGRADAGHCGLLYNRSRTSYALAFTVLVLLRSYARAPARVERPHAGDLCVQTIQRVRTIVGIIASSHQPLLQKFRPFSSISSVKCLHGSLPILLYCSTAVYILSTSYGNLRPSPNPDSLVDSTQDPCTT